MHYTIINKRNILLYFSIILLASCTKDLNRLPITGLSNSTVYSSAANYKLVLAKVYGSLGLNGQQGPFGQPDVSNLDETATSYVRALWNLSELSTDEAVWTWSDGDIYDLHNMNWTSNNNNVNFLYQRLYYIISLSNEFLRQASDGALEGKGFSEADKTEIKYYREEARFIRALAYYNALDYFGNVPFVTENDKVGAFTPPQISRVDLFKYVESELLSLQNGLKEPRQNEYARADKAAAWMLLAKLYLNADVYTGAARYNDCITYCNKVIGAGFSLAPKYANNFLSDNNTSPEIIFPITFDALKGQNYGGMTYLVHMSVMGNMKPADYGIPSGGWYCARTTKKLVNQFDDPSGNTDQRAIFHSSGQNLEVNTIGDFTQGYTVGKYKNVTSGGVTTSDPTGTYVSTDFPLFRLADVYLMYAEAAVRGGGGDVGIATNYINLLRGRAYGNNAGNVNSSALTLDFIMNERQRELYFECTRRTDLIRFGKFTSADYLWPFKGGVINGTGVAQFRNLYPIPSSEITSNPNLKQNTGYN